MAIPIIIDTDGGIDDAAAIWWALADPDLEIRAITTVAGNVSVDLATRNVCSILDAAGRPDIPVAVGASEPFGPAPAIPGTDMIHGADGLGYANLPEPTTQPGDESATDLIARIVADDPGNVVIATIGPLSNVAHALTADPGIADAAAGLYAMGGVVARPGNTTAVTEFNIVADPSAAATVVAADWRRRTMVTLDATEVATLSPEDLAALDDPASDAARFLAGPIGYYRNIAAMLHPDGAIALHDALAVMAISTPAVLVTEQMPLQVDTGESAAWGATVADRRVGLLADLPEEVLEMARAEIIGDKPLWEITVDANRDLFRKQMRGLFAGDQA